MPVSTSVPIRRLSQAEFGELSFEVMRHAFAIHNDLGRFFDEKIYKRELACRLPGVKLELPIDVTFGAFHKRYALDACVRDAGIVEFKSVEALSGRHRAQLLHYLLLCDVAHGKLVNLRPEDVEHEFVNTQWERADRRAFEVVATRWNAALPGAALPGAAQLGDYLVSLLRDLGTGLEISLYEEAVVHSFGGAAAVDADVRVEFRGRELGVQRMRVIAPGVACKITAFDNSLDRFEAHAQRLLSHTSLRAIAWININLKQVTLTTLEK